MENLLIIETRDAAEHRGPERMMELAMGMQAAGTPTAVFLAENAVFSARRGPGLLNQALQGGLAIAADEFALAERGISATELLDGVVVADVGLIVDHLASGASVMWR